MSSLRSLTQPLSDKLIVTGANGFIGNAIFRRLLQDHRNVIGAVRREWNVAHTSISPPLDETADWRRILSRKSVVIHSAGRAHILKGDARKSIKLFQQVNTVGTLTLAAQAAEVGVRRFIFISSIGVNGTKTTRPFLETDHVNPVEPYALSKFEAEQGLFNICQKSGMEIVIIRPPPVYGPHAPGNFGLLMRWLSLGIPLPLGAIDNKRSLVALDNLVDLIVTCIDHPVAANQTFLVSDGEDLSTTQLLRRMGQAMGKPARLICVPPALLKVGAVLVGKPELAQRLCGSLQVDISKARELLDWKPPISVDEGLRRAAEGFKREAPV
jgi:nucleoside-diphosphate-sugar epimerase